jgi:hypothetical protein
LSTVTFYSINLTKIIRQEKQIAYRKARRKSNYLFANFIILYFENARFHNKKTTRTDEAGAYKINTQKLAFLYTTNELLEKEIMEAIPFTMAT